MEVEQKIGKYPRYWEIRPCLIPKYYYEKYFIVPVIQYQDKKLDNPYKIIEAEFKECPEHEIEEAPHPLEDESEKIKVNCILLHLYHFFGSFGVIKHQIICVNNIRFVSEMGNAANPDPNQAIKFCNDYDRITVEVGVGDLRCVVIAAMKEAKKVGHNIIIL
jgi:hypothetical protein